MCWYTWNISFTSKKHLQILSRGNILDCDAKNTVARCTAVRKGTDQSEGVRFLLAHTYFIFCIPLYCWIFNHLHHSLVLFPTAFVSAQRKRSTIALKASQLPACSSSLTDIAQIWHHVCAHIRAFLSACWLCSLGTHRHSDADAQFCTGWRVWLLSLLSPCRNYRRLQCNAKTFSLRYAPWLKVCVQSKLLR